MLLPTLKDKNIVFLDFDGVLNHAGCKVETDFLQESIDVLNQIYDEYNIQIVLSTSWKDAYVFTDLIQLLKEKGIKAPVIDKTCTYLSSEKRTYNITYISEEEFNASIDPMVGRNREILNYVRIHDIEHYVILDDIRLTNPELLPHQVLTSYFDETNGGLRKKHLPLIRQILSQEA